MIYKNLTTGQTTHSHGLAWLWYNKGHGDPIEIYRWNPSTGKWDDIGGWVLL